MPRPAEAQVWWAEVEDVRVRIEQRRARERPTARRGVREIAPAPRLTFIGADARGARRARRRPRLRAAQRIGSRPDRLASWAVALGFLLVLTAALSAHG